MKIYAKPEAFLITVEPDTDIMSTSPTRFNYMANQESDAISDLEVVNW